MRFDKPLTQFLSISRVKILRTLPEGIPGGPGWRTVWRWWSWRFTIDKECVIEKMVVHDIEQYVEERVVLDVHYGLQCVVEKTVVLEV